MAAPFEHRRFTTSYPSKPEFPLSMSRFGLPKSREILERQSYTGSDNDWRWPSLTTRKPASQKTSTSTRRTLAVPRSTRSLALRPVSLIRPLSGRMRQAALTCLSPAPTGVA